MRILRWLLVIPAVVVAFYAVFLFGLLAVPFVDEALCPAGQMSSGGCTNASVRRVMEGTMFVLAALSAVAVLLVGTAIAPERKKLTAWVLFAAGTAIALAFATVGAGWSYALTAIAAGLITALLMSRRYELPPVASPDSAVV